MGRPWLGGKKGMRARKIASGICVDCPKPAQLGVTRCLICTTRSNEGRLRRHAKLKVEVFTAYGGFRCSCCNETHEEFLHIDHANGDGAQHRKELNDPTGANMYAWLKKNNFPPGFRVLCANCNWAFGRYGYCPHQRENQVREPRFITPAGLAAHLDHETK